MGVTLQQHLRNYVLQLLPVLGLVTAASVLSAVAAAEETAPRRQYALLIGCTEYQNTHVGPLYGPANDVNRYYDLLTDKQGGFKFAADHIQRLVGWPDDPEQRPTCANIRGAFERLIAMAAPNTQMFVLLAGHGVQVPVPEDQSSAGAENAELDGLDEVFLPADVTSWKHPDGLKNAITDDQLGIWLQAIRAKGADVWIVFDCCHSGSMSRGSEQLERARSVRPQDLGIPDAAIAAALRRVHGKRGGEASRGAPGIESGALQLTNQKTAADAGSLVAFYAAQSWETAPELPRPEASPPTGDNYYGLLSYTLAECLQQHRRSLSYRDLAQLLVARYRAERRSRPPTPAFEGDLDQEVLGAGDRPARNILLQHEPGELRINAGAIHGLTQGSVLSVHPPIGDRRDSKTVLGYLEVTRLTTVTAIVTPCEFTGHSLAEADDLPELAVCEIVSRQFGDMRIQVAVRGLDDAADPEKVQPRQNLSTALAGLSASVQPLVKVVPDDGNAEWVLQLTVPEQAKRQFGLTVPAPTVLLLQGCGDTGPILADSDKTTAGGARSGHRKIYGQYPASTPEQIIVGLNRDLPRIFKWQNIWRIAGTMSGNAGESQGGLIFDVVRLRDAHDRSAGETLRDTCVRAGQVLEYRFENDSDDDLWVAVLFLDADFGVDVYRAGSLRAGRVWKPIRVMINDDSLGVEGVVVFTAPMSVCGHEPDYAFLRQKPLGVVEMPTRSALPMAVTPFEKLMEHATSLAGIRGGSMLTAPDDPTVLSRSWVTVSADSTAPH